MFGVGWQELLVIFLLILILFGAKKLPELAKALATSLKEFKKALLLEKESDEEIEEIKEDERRDRDRRKKENNS